VRFKVLSAVGLLVKTHVVWEVMLCRLENSYRDWTPNMQQISNSSLSETSPVDTA